MNIKTINKMTGRISLSAIVLLGALFFNSCKKNNEPEVTSAAVEVTVAYDEEYGITDAKGLSISLKNVQTGRVFTAETNQEGKVSFADVPAGTYDASTNITLTPSKYLELTGQASLEDLIFSATASSVNVLPSQTNTIKLTLRTAIQNALIIKQIYYGGSSTSKAAGQNDQFIELYNNSSEVVYADSVVISQLMGARQTTQELTRFHLLENLALDWSKSANMPTNINANTDYVYGNSYMIPGTGKQHPIQPGKSIIIAKSALNFKGSFTAINGTTYSPSNPELTVDLSTADFEVTHNGLQTQVELENPSVPNMVVFARFNSNDMILDRYGKDAIIIWKAPGGPAKFPKYGRPYLPTASIYYEGVAYDNVQIPIQYIMDAVELQPSDGVRSVKRLSAKFDSGYTFNVGGEYSSTSVIRKTLRTVNGRNILQDTNNSTNDFITIKAEPKAFAN